MEYNNLSDFRKVVAVDLTTRCNYRCSFCILSVEKHPNQDMPFNQFKRIVDEIKEEGSIDTIYLHFFGEPYLYPQIFEAIRYVKTRGLNSSLATNGSLFDHKMIGKICENPPTHMVVSLQDRLFKERYDKTRGRSVSHDKYMAGIRAFLKRRIENNDDKKKDGKVDIEIAFDHYDTLRRRLLGLHTGDPSIRIKPKELFLPLYGFLQFLRNDITQIEIEKSALKNALVEQNRKNAYFEIKYKIFRNIYLVFKAVNPNKDYFNRIALTYGSCDSRYLVIAVNGDIRLCCIDYLGHTTIGNIFRDDSSILDCCKERIPVFASLREGSPELECCRRCLGAPTYRGVYVLNSRNLVRRLKLSLPRMLAAKYVN